MRELDARRRRGELPVNRGACSIAGGFDRGEFVDQRCFSRNTALQALARKDTQFNFGHVQPTSMLRRIVKLQLLPHPVGFRGGKRFVERARFVSIEIV